MGRDGREVVVVGAVRTPIGRGRADGAFRDLHAADLLGRAYVELLARTGVDPTAVEAALVGCVQQLGEQSYNVGRSAWLQEGLPIEASATTLDLQCGSGQQAVGIAAALIAAGVHEVAIGAGVEHMGHIPLSAGPQTHATWGAPFTDALLARHPVVGQGLGAELIAERYGVSRAEMDALSARSHALAQRATAAGAFAREIVETAGWTTDEGIRPDTTVEVLAGLKPVFKPDGQITAGSSSQISDGAAAVLLASRAAAERLGLEPRATIVDHVAVGCDPVKMLEGPIPATRALLERNGLAIGDVDRFEVSEAFASVVGAWAHVHEPDMDRVNVRGGAIALGHPLGASGARLLATLLHTLEDEDAELGLATMCCGGGLGVGTLVRRL